MYNPAFLTVKAQLKVAYRAPKNKTHPIKKILIKITIKETLQTALKGTKSEKRHSKYPFKIFALKICRKPTKAKQRKSPRGWYSTVRAGVIYGEGRL